MVGYPQGYESPHNAPLRCLSCYLVLMVAVSLMHGCVWCFVVKYHFHKADAWNGFTGKTYVMCLSIKNTESRAECLIHVWQYRFFKQLCVKCRRQLEYLAKTCIVQGICPLSCLQGQAGLWDCNWGLRGSRSKLSVSLNNSKNI